MYKSMIFPSSRKMAAYINKSNRDYKYLKNKNKNNRRQRLKKMSNIHIHEIKTLIQHK